MLEALCEYFGEVEMRTEKGTALRIVSDGRGGNGVQHWRAVYSGEILVAGLTGHLGERGAVTVGKNGDLRQGEHLEFATFAGAVEYIKSTL